MRPRMDDHVTSTATNRKAQLFRVSTAGLSAAGTLVAATLILTRWLG